MAGMMLLTLSVTNGSPTPVDAISAGGWSLCVGQNGELLVWHKKSATPVQGQILLDTIAATGIIGQQTPAYQSAELANGVLIAVASATLPGGSVLAITDTISVAGEGDFVIDRTARVMTVKEGVVGFRTGQNFADPAAHGLGDVEPFVPGMWYATENHVPQSGLISNADHPNHLFREDRLPIPLASFRDKSSSLVISLMHDQPDGQTFWRENTAATVIDGRMRFASLGLQVAKSASVAIEYPGAEIDESTVGSKRGRPPSQRLHPLEQNFVQHYRMRLHLCFRSRFDDAMQDCWRNAYAAIHPPVIKQPLDKIYSSSTNLLDHYYAVRNGAPGFPFDVSLPDGKVHAVSYQMGFVGEQIPCAAHMIAAGFASARPDLIDKGDAIASFWADHCLAPSGLPRTWYDPEPAPHWRDYKTFTRIATDGMQGLLQSWHRMRLGHRDRPRWLDCCKTFGNWLVDHQNHDGSFFRQYDFDGQPLLRSKSSTLHPVRFLVDLSFATGDGRYQIAARRAAEFALDDIGSTANYYGGTADNNDVTDKESGWIAFDSFLSLYDCTHDPRWLTAARRAAAFTETWIYCWNVPIDRADPALAFPRVKTTAGMSLIATGHSGADCFLAFAPFAYERLAIYADDPHAAEIASLLMHNTRQLVDVDGSNGYAVPGLLTEAFTLAPPRGHGVNVWLPWCTAAVLDPMLQLHDAFGTSDPAQVQMLDPAQKRKLLSAYSARHGF